MKIVLLDRESIGYDTPLGGLLSLGDVEIYDSTSPCDIFERTNDANVIIINKVKITSDVIANAKKLQLICVFATGYDNIDIDAARRHGVAVCNVPGYSTDSVTACTISTTLALLTKLRIYNDYVVSGEYSISERPNLLTPVFHDVSGKTWGIIGCGDIGGSVAKVATALGANVITYQRHQHPIYPTVTLDDLCSRSDIITIHCPLNNESRSLINDTVIHKMKRSVILVNAARGAVLDEKAVASAIKNGRIGGFGCDVYSCEPFNSEHPYFEIKTYDNVLLTPHCAWGSFEARTNCINIICDNISQFYSGKTSNRVDI